MQLKFLKQVVEQVAGEPAIKIVDLLSVKKDVNEFVIAKKLGLTINQTRNLLYKLSHLGILSSVRKKDKRKGWYIYFWTLNVLRSLEILEEKLQEKISNLEAEVTSKKSKRFYKCKLCGVEVTEESALLCEFVCPECGEVYELSDTEQHIMSSTKELLKLKKELNLIQQEREKEETKKGRKLSRSIKKVEKEKKAKRKQAREKRLRDKRREERKRLKLKAKKAKKKTKKKQKKEKKKPKNVKKVKRGKKNRRR